MPLFVRLALALVLGAAGCATTAANVYSKRIGRPYPERPVDCELVFDYLDSQSMLELATAFFPVASLELPNQPKDFQYTPEIEIALRPEACRFGGELVAYQGSYYVSLFLGTASRFLVYKRKSGTAAPAAPPRRKPAPASND